MSQRFYATADDFFPPEIIRVLHSFAHISYSDAPLLAGVVGRIQDLLLAPSPRRLSCLLGLFAQLHISHPAAVNPVLEWVPRKVPEFLEEIPCVLRSLSALHVHERNLIEPLALQAALHSERMKADFVWAFEAAARHGVEVGEETMEEGVKAVKRFGTSREGAMSHKVALLAACARTGLTEEAKTVRASVLEAIGDTRKGGGAASNLKSTRRALSVLSTMASVRLPDREIMDCAMGACEKALDYSVPSLSLQGSVHGGGSGEDGGIISVEALSRACLHLALLDYDPRTLVQKFFCRSSSPHFHSLNLTEPASLVDLLYAFALVLYKGGRGIIEQTEYDKWLRAVLPPALSCWRRVSIQKRRQMAQALVVLREGGKLGSLLGGDEEMKEALEDFWSLNVSEGEGTGLPPLAPPGFVWEEGIDVRSLVPTAVFQLSESHPFSQEGKRGAREEPQLLLFGGVEDEYVAGDPTQKNRKKEGADRVESNDNPAATAEFRLQIACTAIQTGKRPQINWIY